MNHYPRLQHVAVLVLTNIGPLSLLLNPDSCPLCEHGVIRVWNPQLRDCLTQALTPPDKQVWHLPCPNCRPDAFQTWQGDPQ